jgi:hypothetical protein
MSANLGERSLALLGTVLVRSPADVRDDAVALTGAQARGDSDLEALRISSAGSPTSSTELY